MRPYVVLLSATFILYFILSSGRLVIGQEFKSEQYRIESGTFVLDLNENSTISNYDLPSRFGISSQKKFMEKGYAAISREKVGGAGKAYTRLHVSRLQLVFDTAETGDQSVQQSSVKLLGQSASQALISVRQESEFKNNFGAKIPSTRCDDSQDPCTPIEAGIWRKSYGFGYRVDGGSAKDFEEKSSYRPLYVTENEGFSAVIFSQDVGMRGAELHLELKLRPKPQTETGLYKSTVVITAGSDF